ncbi:MAG: tRNA 2-thiocytidine(32) synthetase TtcA [Clostridiales bacterium]|jgi:tRNA 2-thiocytidine biosynthesis protein TtcA|nr:tRNA 2-thiocytidine(32) synthetase TtcA [Clostridiales bacterium]
MLQKVLSFTRRCIEDYDMIAPNDRIAAGVSGGKDSLTMLLALANLKRFYPVPFELEAVTLDMGFEGMDFSPITVLCDELGIHHTVIKTQLKEIIFDVRREENPCSLCAKMRRGALHDAAISIGCNKCALGHHHDDAVETLMLSLFYEGRIGCFRPVTYLDRKNITLIRPMLYTPERLIRSLANGYPLPVIKNPCPADGNSKRQKMKDLVKMLDKQNPGLRERLFGAMQRLPLEGWEKTDIRR